jgi:hypothetical protein
MKREFINWMVERMSSYEEIGFVPIILSFREFSRWEIIARRKKFGKRDLKKEEEKIKADQQFTRDAFISTT